MLSSDAASASESPAHSLQGPLYHQGWAQLCVYVSHGVRSLCAVVIQSHLLPLWANSGEGWWRSMSEMSVFVTLDIEFLAKALSCTECLPLFQ